MKLYAADAPYLTILSCGPDEYLEAFRQQMRRDSPICPQPVRILPLQAEEWDEYVTWYGTRTKQKDVKPVAQTNFVVINFLLEQRRQGHANLEEYALRLRARLEDNGVLETFLIALAVNRAGYCHPLTPVRWPG